MPKPPSPPEPGEPMEEPEEGRREVRSAVTLDARIVRASIHPGIGIARVGNSTVEDGFFIGPEVLEPELAKSGQSRDAQGAIKRQAARFRIFGYDAAGEVVGEIGADDADIRWTVHLANKKAQWYQFQLALDLPEADTVTTLRRNTGVEEAQRAVLAIDPGPRTIEGKGAQGQRYRFDSGTFLGTPVMLGELRTDEAGRLLVLGGFGNSASPEGKPIFDSSDTNSFGNAEGWYDDVADGPVTATVAFGEREVPVEGAWVVVAPPNFAPDVIAWRTLYDLLVDAYVRHGWMEMPEKVSFTRDVLPVLRRLSNLQWVNKGFFALFGHGGPMNFDDPALISKLSHRPTKKGGPDPYSGLRQVIFNSFRPAGTKVNEPRLWPWIYGDTSFFAAASPRSSVSLPSVTEELLCRWMNGDFVNDWDPDAESPRNLDELCLAERPAMLDQAALHFCLADAFHPGSELTWPMRHLSMYSAPFRIRHRPAGEVEPDYGPKLTQEVALRPGGPLFAQGPGDLTRWMALPWQADTAFCRSGYEPHYDPYLPTYWPARVPNQVLSEKDYLIVIDDQRQRDERIAAFHRREHWLRAIDQKAKPPDQMMQMVSDFGHMGIIEARPGVEDDPDFPPVMWVESHGPERRQALAAVSAERRPRRGLHERAGWHSAEHLEQALRTRIR